jgi:hypothetical protein
VVGEDCSLRGANIETRLVEAAYADMKRRLKTEWLVSAAEQLGLLHVLAVPYNPGLDLTG